MFDALVLLPDGAVGIGLPFDGRSVNESSLRHQSGVEVAPLASLPRFLRMEVQGEVFSGDGGSVDIIVDAVLVILMLRLEWGEGGCGRGVGRPGSGGGG